MLKGTRLSFSSHEHYKEMSPDSDTIGVLLSEIVEKLNPFPISLRVLFVPCRRKRMWKKNTAMEGSEKTTVEKLRSAYC